MKEEQASLPELVERLERLGIAIRIALVVIVLGLSYIPLRESFAIANFAQIFQDMLNGKPLPTLTEFVIRFRLVFELASVLVPVAALTTLFLPLVRSFYLLAALAAAALGLSLLLYHALAAPLSMILSQMYGG